MKIISQSYTLLSHIDSDEMLQLIELAGRTCYKSESKIRDGSADTFIRNIINRHHESVIEHAGFSVKFTTNRGVTHELVRHRIASFSQESTRYCNYEKKGVVFILPSWCSQSMLGEWSESNIPNGMNDAEKGFFDSLSYTEKAYLSLLDAGWTPEKAREVLPNALKTEIVVTANMREWRHIFKERTAKAAHPQIRDLMLPLLNEMKTKLPALFSDIN